jgi:hypothetical protein
VSTGGRLALGFTYFFEGTCQLPEVGLAAFFFVPESPKLPDGGQPASLKMSEV